jgi:hypothetical protein
MTAEKNTNATRAVAIPNLRGVSRIPLKIIGIRSR